MAEESIDEEAIAQVSTIGSLNTILFGAPGTGKTYRTRRLAVKLADPVWYGNHEDDEQAEGRHARQAWLDVRDGRRPAGRHA